MSCGIDPERSGNSLWSLLRTSDGRKRRLPRACGHGCAAGAPKGDYFVREGGLAVGGRKGTPAGRRASRAIAGGVAEAMGRAIVELPYGVRNVVFLWCGFA